MTEHRTPAKQQVGYIAIARNVCKILEIDVPDKELATILQRLDAWADSSVYFTSTQKDIIENVRQIIKDLRESKDADSILQKVEKLEKDVSYDRDFD